MRKNIYIYQNLQDAPKAVLRRKFIAVNTYIIKEGSQINNLIFHFKKLKEEQMKLKCRKRKETENTRVKIYTDIYIL